VKRLLIVLFLSVTLIILSGCEYSGPNDDIAYLQDQIDGVQTQIDDLQNQIDEVKNEIEYRSEDSNFEIYSRLDDIQIKLETLLKQQFKFLTFFPRKGETIEGFVMEVESIGSGSMEKAGIPYYPESVIVAAPNDIGLSGERFSNIEDRKKADNYVNPESAWDTISQGEPYDFNGWKLIPSTGKTDSGGEWDGTYAKIKASYDVYSIWVLVKLDAVSDAEETCEAIAKLIITRYLQAQ
jgi:hypothetical protein